MNRNNMPLILMLSAGAVTYVVTFFRDYTVTGQLFTLLIVLLIFYFLGSALKWTLNYFEEQNEKRNREAGEVIEKEAEDISGAPSETKESESKS